MLTVISNFDLQWDKIDMAKQLLEEAARSEFSVSGPRIIDLNSKVEMNPYYVNRIEASKLKRLIWVTSFFLIYLIYQRLHILKRILSKGFYEIIF